MIKTSLYIIGAILGAGFASGKEIHLFFGKYGTIGYIGIIIASVIIGAIIYKTTQIATKNKINTYEEFLKTIGSQNQIIQKIINIFILITYYIMNSAFAEYFKQELNIPKTIGIAVIAALSYLTTRKKENKIIKINTILIPILIIIIITFGIKNINQETIIKKTTQEIIPSITSAIIYASYNSITLIPILITITQTIKTKKQVKTISIITTLTLIILATAINITIQNIDQNINQIELPTIYQARKEGKIAQNTYGTVIITSIYTTAITTLYSYLKNNTKTEKEYKIKNAIICTSSIIISNISFTTLLNKIYPIFGIIGLIQIYKIFAITLEKKAQN